MTTATSPRSTGRTQGNSPPSIAAVGLSKVFKDFWMRDRARAVDGITFSVYPGEVFGLLGPNGSGKSTTIKMILGLLKKSSGRLSVFGKSPNDVDIKKRIGYLPEESYLYPFLNARETLDYYAKLFHIPHKTRATRVDELLEMVGLTAVQHRQVREYSKGMQRRIGLAQALINDPELLILDEPTTGLDPIGTKQVKDLITHLGDRGKTIILSSHLLADVEDVVDYMVILYGGKIRDEGTCDDLLESQDHAVIETESLDAHTTELIRSAIANLGVRVDSVEPARQRLESLFMDIVERARQQNTATSGAQHGGTTAGFLSTPKDEGDSLISRLTATEPELEVEAVPSANKPAEPEPAPTVIDDLLDNAYDDDAPEPTSSTAQPGAPKPTPTPTPKADAPDIDASLIDALLGDQPNNDNDDDTPNKPGEAAQ